MTSAVAPVIADSWINRSAVRNAVAVVSLTILTAISAQVSIPLPFTPVPITLQTFAVLAGAAALGANRAVTAQALYVAVGALGLPVFAEHSKGGHVVLGATGGYLIGFIVASFAVGRIAEMGATRKVVSTVLAYVAGSVIIYTLGGAWLAHVAGLDFAKTMELGVTPFLAGDAYKAVAAGIALPSLWKLVRK